MMEGNIPGRTLTIPLALYSAVEGGRTDEANKYLAVTVALSFSLIALVGPGERRSDALNGRSRFERGSGMRVDPSGIGL